MTRPNVKELIVNGIKLKQEENSLKDLSKTGTLRGGNSGCILEDGSVIGKCHRLSMLRSMGLQEPKPYSTQLMFDAGFANEDINLDDLHRTWPHGIKCEEEIPISWYTANGTKVTGRPDKVLHKDELPVEVIEEKQIVSIWSARDVVLKDTPKTDHVIQAAHYSWQLGVPATLVYTLRGNLHIPPVKGGWFQREALENIERFGEEYIELKGPDFPFKFKPFIKQFQLEWRYDRLYYRGFDDWVRTEVTTQGIESYYEKTSEMPTRRVLGPMLSDKDLCGNKAKDLCQHCVLEEECNSQQTDYDFDRFIDSAKRLFRKE